MESTINFSYNIQIGRGANMLRNGAYKEFVPNCGQVVISSKSFSSYADCERAMNGLLTTLTRIEGRDSERNFVIVSKVNPVLDTSGKKHADATSWDRHTISRAYMADSEELKNAILKYHVLAQIRSDLDVSRYQAEILDKENPVVD